MILRIASTMPKSGIKQQICVCESGQRPEIALSFFGTALRRTPRLKTTNQTLYICPVCVERMQPATRELILATVQEIADALNTAIGPRKENNAGI
jgi:hypothetical protein